MGLGEWWGGKYKLTPGTQGDIDRFGGIMGQAKDYFNSAGLGKAGKISKNILMEMQKGDFDTNPLISSFFAPVRNQIETGKRDLVRRASMGVNRIAPGQQAGLLNAQTGLAQNRADEAGGMAIQAMVPQLFGQASNTFQNALQGKRGQEQFGLGMEGNMAEAMNRARMAGTYKTGGFRGFLNDAAGIAGAVAPMFMGMPKIGGKSGPAGGWGDPQYAG